MFVRQYGNNKIIEHYLINVFFLYRCLFLLSRLENQNCPNEAEFRAYDILLNLNEGDTLR